MLSVTMSPATPPPEMVGLAVVVAAGRGDQAACAIGDGAAAGKPEAGDIAGDFARILHGNA